MRTLLVPSAQYWFNAAREQQTAGNHAHAILCMENALNHTENALAYVKDKVPGVKEELEKVQKSVDNSSKNGKVSA